MQIFGYLYDFSKFARHFREILCEGQIAAFKMMDSTDGESHDITFDSANISPRQLLQ